MLSRKTCLLLGAGASNHLGFPLGAELRMQLLAELRVTLSTSPKDRPEDLRRSGEDIRRFYDRLAHGNWSSPDAFLERFPEFMKTGKYLMCKILANYEDDWALVQRGGWYDNLKRAIHTDGFPDLKRNNLSIITFNYDRSIDFFLHKYIEHQFMLPSALAWSTLTTAIPIIHLHGTLGPYPTCGYGDKSNLYERGQDIKIISEIADNLPDFERASELLNGADRVVVFGFGFGENNVKRLQFLNEQKIDERDIIIAAGGNLGQQYEQSMQKHLARWGLQPGRHFHLLSANEIFAMRVNPFA